MTETEHSVIFQTLGVLLKIKRKIAQIEKSNEDNIKDLAKQVVKTLIDDPTERQTSDFLKQLQYQNFDTFSVLSIDLPTLSNEINSIIEKSLNKTINDAIDGNNITQYTFAQIVETYRVTSFMIGYLIPWKMAAFYYQQKIKDAKFWDSYIEYYRKMATIEHKKSYIACKSLLQQASIESPKVTRIDIDLNPSLGFDTTEGTPEDYSHFRLKLDTASIKWEQIGHDYGSEKYLKAEKPIHFDGVV